MAVEKFYYHINDHLGNCRVVVNEQGDVEHAYDYYPFGKVLRTGGGGNKEIFTFTGKELDEDGDLDWYYFGARFYDPEIGRWMSVDPLDEFHSPYVYVGNNPVLMIDPNGMETYVDRYGEVLHDYDIFNPNDPSVFLITDYGTIDWIGDIGGDINVNYVFNNFMEKNVEDAKGIFNPKTFEKLVTDKGDWDIKLNTNTIYGLGYQKNSIFHFDGWKMTGEDLGNYHYGVVGDAVPIFNRYILLYMAGANQIEKGRSRQEWQKYHTFYDPTSGFYIRKILPPYGDDPYDQMWINRGFKYYQNKFR